MRHCCRWVISARLRQRSRETHSRKLAYSSGSAAERGRNQHEPTHLQGTALTLVQSVVLERRRVVDDVRRPKLGDGADDRPALLRQPGLVRRSSEVLELGDRDVVVEMVLAAGRCQWGARSG